MFAKIAVVLSTLSLLAAALPTATPATSQCNTGSAQCCNSVSKASDAGTAQLLGLLGVVVQDVTAQVGFGCSPIVGVLGNNCAQTPVCCQGNQQNGLVNVGCSPISL